MILSDRDIRCALETGAIGFSSPYDDVFAQIGPSSLDFRLGRVFKSYKRDSLFIIDPAQGIDSEHIDRIELNE